jgi:5'-methylthioadenosine phosphorylase
MKGIKLGVIGGSGIYELKNVTVEKEIQVRTPFGEPSDKIVIGHVGPENRQVAFLPRHGKGHRILPGELPSKANIYALKSLGVKKIIAVSAVGSLKEEIRPTDIVLPAQIIDRTKSRPQTFFGDGIVGHISFADPFCDKLRSDIAGFTKKFLEKNNPGKRLFTDETYICMEGPQFSTRAESKLYRSWGAGVIGMTALPEAKLAREAEIAYAIIAMSTDYDCWREHEQAVDGAMVQEYMKENNKTINDLLPYILENLSTDDECDCHSAAKFAVFTNPAVFPSSAKKKLELFYGKYWK